MQYTNFNQVSDKAREAYNRVLSALCLSKSRCAYAWFYTGYMASYTYANIYCAELAYKDIWFIASEEDDQKRIKDYFLKLGYHAAQIDKVEKTKKFLGLF